MKKICLIVSWLFLWSASASAADSFIEGMEDIPLPHNMVQIPSDNISFGNEETRLVEAYLKANFMKYSWVVDFYKETLPQLGWKFTSEHDNVLSFSRENEALDISQESSMPLIVRVTLTGQP